MSRAIGLNLLPLHIQKRPDDAVPPAVLDAGQAVDPGAPQNPHENSLRLVVPVVRGGCLCDSLFAGNPAEKTVTRKTSGSLKGDSLLLGQLPHLYIFFK